MDLSTFLRQLPPGVNLYDFLADTVQKEVSEKALHIRGMHLKLCLQIYPDPGKAFSVQVYV